MKRLSFIAYLAIVFVVLSVLIYLIHFLIFRDTHHIFIYMIGDLAFLPLEVLLVVLILERILAQREKKTRMQRLNMVVGAFFNEIGNHLLGWLLKYFNNKAEISSRLDVTKNWDKKEFRDAIEYANHLKIEVDCSKVDLPELKAFLARNREFLLTLLGNPSMLEHDRFTDLLWAVTHLDEELEFRPSVVGLPEADLKHLGVDIQRLYDHLASEWLDYIEHLCKNYSYLYSLVLRTHPFQDKPSAVFT